jgi:hypothetical protein
MADNAPATADQFITNYGVAPDVAASLAAQANAMSGRSGHAAKAEAEHSVDNYIPPSPAAPAAQPTAQELTDLANAHDAAPMEAAFAAEFAPAASPSEFSLPEPAGGHTDETMAYDAQVKAAFHTAGMNAKSMNLAAQMLQQDMPAQQGKTLDQIIDAQTTGLERMWKGEADSNLNVWRDIVTGWQRSADPLIRQYAQAAARLNPIVVNRLVEEAKQRTARSK